MPYKLVKSGSKYYVENSDTGKRHSNKPMSKRRAVMQMRALYAAENSTSKDFTVMKQADGSYRWVLFSSTAFQDRDGDIVSQKALEADVERSDVDGYYGPLRWWHLGDYAFADEKDYTTYTAGKGIDIGDCDFRMMQGKVLVESGTFRSKEIGEAVADAGPLGASIRFSHPKNEPDGENVFAHIKCFERSLMPRGKESNRFTKLFVREDETMATAKEKIEAFTKLVGDKAEEILLAAGLVEKEAESAGVVSKEEDVPAEVEDKAASKEPGDYLVVEKPGDGKADVLHLQVKKNGVIDHGLMGAAHAALTSPEGFRGNPYAGPEKDAAIAKLKKMYADESMTWPEDEAATKKKEYSFGDISGAISTALHNARPNENSWVQNVYEEHYIWSDWKSGKLYAQQYDFDDETGIAELVGDPVEVVQRTYYTPAVPVEQSDVTSLMASMKELKDMLTSRLVEKEVQATDAATSAKEASEAQLKRIEALEMKLKETEADLTHAKEVMDEMQSGLPRGIKALQGMRASQSQDTVLKDGSSLTSKDARPMIDPQFITFATGNGQ